MRIRSVAAVFLFFVACSTTSTTPRPAPGPAPVISPNRLTPLATSPRSIPAPLIRVGLLSDQETATFARLDGGYIIVSDAGPHTLRRGFTVSAPLAGAVVRYAIQLATLSDRTSAEALERKIESEDALPVDLIIDAATGSLKVLAGVFETSGAAEPVRSDLIRRGYPSDAIVVKRPATTQFENALQLVDDEGDRHRLSTSTLLVLPADAESVAIGGQPYRGGARLVINPRGLLNVVNELNLEDYVRGVVPNEMGPFIFDELEALKAQALAARTYAIRRLGEFRPEGYDICPTPACQVYKGRATEHALSDQAVAETAGRIIVYKGEPIDALYTSTCGGETSDVGVMFPGRSEPYLRHARCVEGEIVRIDGRADSGMLTDMQSDARLFAVLTGAPVRSEGFSAGDVIAAARAAGSTAGYALREAAAPRSIRRGDVLSYLGAALEIARFGSTLLLPEDRQYFFPAGGAEEPAKLAAGFLMKYKVGPSQNIDRLDLDAAMPRDEVYALLLAWLREIEAVRDVSGKIAAIDGRTLSLKAEGKVTRHQLPAGIPLVRKLGDRSQEYASLPVMPGDRVNLLVDASGRPRALTLGANFDGAAFDRTSSFSSWTRSYRAADLVASIARRNPITALADLRPKGTDPSKRVTELEVAAENGRTFTLTGLPIRWSLNVPDNLFVISRSKDPDGMDRYTFFGKGWGHGTGMCQVGTYGMAFRGWTADRIVKHWYADVEIVERRP